MDKVNRFIQFNDESVDTRSFMLFERLSRALADANYLELTERKLVEFNPTEGILSMSVFWRHRSNEVMRLGRLSDIYLLSAGFWKHFDVVEWVRFTTNYQSHSLKNLARELLLLLEEFRLIDKIISLRPGTVHAFNNRRKVYTAFHKANFYTNMKKGYLADALLNDLFVSLHEGLFSPSSVDLSPLTDLQVKLIKNLLSHVYESQTTTESIRVVQRIIEVVEEVINKDLFNQYYSIVDSITEEKSAFHYHDGVEDADKGEEQPKETIEEVFRSWHEENEDEAGVHLQYELEHGRSSDLNSGEAQAGSDQASIEEVGTGQSHGDTTESDHKVNEETKESSQRDDTKKAGTMFGKEHVNVVFEEKRIERTNEQANRLKLAQWREEQKPYVRAFVAEMKKRIEVKDYAISSKRMIGRLSKNLTTLVIDERPKPFYRKNAPSKELDAVFGLLVDGSASMIDKLEETKKAVLLFHDVLRSLSINHDINLYYEDAFKASSTIQPNIFEQIHTFSDRASDSGLSILSLDAHEDNRDGFALRWMANRLEKRHEKHKFLLLFSDGEPSAFGYDRNGVIDTAEAVKEAEKKGIAVIHLFLSEVEPSIDQKQFFSMMFGNKTAASSSVENFTDQTLRILRKLLTIVIQQT